MKANEAPKKLYIALNELTEDGRTFVLDHRVDYPTCTEYVRTDAVIEKAVKWISNNCYIPHATFEDFKKAMKL